MDGSLLVGLAMLAFGLGTLVTRFVAPDSGLLSKLGPMKERWGERTGTTIHWIAYTILPIVAGAVVLARALATDAGV